MKVWHVLDIGTPLSEVANQAERAERLGFDVLALPDIIHDGLMAATLAVQATRDITIATSALIAFPRSPMTVAVAAWDLQALSGGRFVLGLGPQVRGNIVDRYSTPWTPPAPRMREYVQSIRAIFNRWQNGTPLRFEGEHYRFTRMQPFTSPPPIEHPDIPIILAGIGPNMTALAGELADGLFTHPTNASPRFLRERARPGLAKGAARQSERKAGTTLLLANPMCATGRKAADVARRREEHREMMALLLSTPPYWQSLDLFGWEDVGGKLHSLTREGRWKDMTALVTDEMLDTLVPTAPWSDLGDLLAEQYTGLADAITLAMPADPEEDTEVAPVIERLKEAM
jgi:probable F420-dependent oxidoreductase